MATSRPARPPVRPAGAAYRYSRSSYTAHMPTLEPMLDEESEEDDGDTESPSAPTTPSSDPSPSIDYLDPHTRELSSVSTADDSPPFDLLPSPLTGPGGVGLFATRALPRGTLIFTEPPLFTLPLTPGARTNSAVMSALAMRTRDEQREFFALSNAYKVPRPGRRTLLPALGIFVTNALPCGPPLLRAEGKAVSENEADAKPGKRGRGGTTGAREGVFLRAARLNHSCRPNVARVWDAHAQEMSFRATRHVRAGEELSLNYADVDILSPRATRAAEIADAFGFECACEACTHEGDEGVESDRRRTAVRRLFEEIGACGKEPSLGLRKVKIALGLLQEEQLTQYEASFCFDAFQLCTLVSDVANAKMWARKAWEASCATSGPDSPAARTFKMYWANPRAHQPAETLPPTTLSGPDSDSDSIPHGESP